MCFGVPAQVLSCGEKMTVRIRGAAREVISMCEASPGDFVLISQGVATAVLSPEEAKELGRVFNEGG